MPDIYDKLSYLQETKSLIKEALINKNQSVDDSTAFREYTNKIAQIMFEAIDRSTTHRTIIITMDQEDIMEELNPNDDSIGTLYIYKYAPQLGSDTGKIGYLLFQSISNNETTNILSVKYKLIDEAGKFPDYEQCVSIALDILGRS